MPADCLLVLVWRAGAAGVSPGRLRAPRKAPAARDRAVSRIQHRMTWLQHPARHRGRIRLWLWPTPWPNQSEGLQWVLNALSASGKADGSAWCRRMTTRMPWVLKHLDR